MDYSSAAAQLPHHMATQVPFPFYDSSAAAQAAANPAALQSYFHSLYSNPNPNPNDNANPSSDPNAVGYYAHSYSAAAVNPADANYGAFQGYDFSSLAVTVGNNAVSATRARYGAAANGAVKIFNSNTAADLSKKMRKVIDGGASSDSIQVCVYCNVVCNSEKVFVRHCVGAKHVMLTRGSSSGGGLYGQGQGLVKSYSYKANPMKLPNKPQSVIRCDICKVDCNSQEMFNSHIMGRKHKNKLEKPKAPMLKALEAPKAIKGLDSDGGPQKMKKPEDLEEKKRKVIEGGAAVTAVRICMLCNVVCNSETVFQIHCSGQKHKNAVKSQGGAAC